MGKKKSDDKKYANKRWNVLETKTSIENLEQSPILWNLKHPNYKNKMLRASALQAIRVALGTDSDKDANDVKDKIHCLRSQHSGTSMIITLFSLIFKIVQYSRKIPNFLFRRKEKKFQ